MLAKYINLLLLSTSESQPLRLFHIHYILLSLKLQRQFRFKNKKPIAGYQTGNQKESRPTVSAIGINNIIIVGETCQYSSREAKRR